jgi:potassium-transporting ATPase KdpC subunit
MLSELRPASLVFVVLTLVTGAAYPLVTTLIGRVAFPSETSGSVIERDGRAVGSRLLGQPFTSPQYFWSRPSATAPVPYNGAVSSGSNQGPLSPALAAAAAEYQIARVARVRNLAASEVAELVRAHTEGRTFGVLGEPRVNVLELNLALDALVTR